MKVILKENIKGVGKKDEIINASDGYARNFLFPKNLAVEANAENLSKLKAKNESKEYQKEQEKEAAKKIADKMAKIQLKIQVKAGENGKIFGGVSSKEIANAFKEQHGMEIDKKKIVLDEPIRSVGTTIVSVKLHKDVVGKLNVRVREA